MQDTKITKERIKHHFTYSWWKYVLLICVAAFGWNMIYTTTGYRAPKEKRLDITFVGYSIPDDVVQLIRMDILAKYPQVEDSTVSSITYTADDNYYGNMQLTTYMGAGEGDIYFLPRERFDALAASDVFVPLDEYVASGAIDVGDMDISRGIVPGESGEKVLYGIPTDDLYGMMDMGIDNRGLVACVMLYTKNEDVAIDWLNSWVQDNLAPKPAWLEEQEQKLNVNTDGASSIPSF